MTISHKLYSKTNLPNKEELHHLWANDCKIYIDKKLYRVGKMSYGDYFAEPVKINEKQSELKPFNKGTFWFPSNH